MRLIDADKLKEEYRDDTEIGNALRMLVDLQPTAYDIDNVLEELKKEMQNDYRCWRNDVIEEMIKIVKRGGKNENR